MSKPTKPMEIPKKGIDSDSWLRYISFEINLFLNQKSIISFLYQILMIIVGFGFLIILSNDGFPVEKTMRLMAIYLYFIWLFKPPPGSEDEIEPFSETLEDIKMNLEESN